MLETTDEDWRAVIDADLSASFRLSRDAIRQMQPQGWGRIIMTSSVMGRVARPTVAGYVTAKHALVGLVRALAVEFAGAGITVNAIGPGYFPTEANQTLHQDQQFHDWVAGRTPAGRWGRPEELQGAVVFLASDAASYVTGQILMVDGGLTAAALIRRCAHLRLTAAGGSATARRSRSAAAAPAGSRRRA